MASVATGSNVAIRESFEQQFDPQQGNISIEVWNGTRNQIAAIAPGFRVLGAKVKTVNRGALWTLTATWPTEFGSVPGGGPVEIPTEKWDIEIEWAQVDIRSSPKFLAAFGNEQTVAILMRRIDAAIKAQLSLTDYFSTITPAIGAPTENEQKAYRLRARGAEGYEIKRPVITRRRTYSDAYPTPITVDAVEKVYTTAKLISTFGVPLLIQRKLPTDPTQIPAETVWGWRLRKQDGTYQISRNKIEEVQDWVYTAWSTLLYDIVS